MANEGYKKIISKNRKATFNYYIEEVIEAGIILTGPEVKSLREGKSSIEDAHADISRNSLQLYNLYISEYAKANKFSLQSSRRPRILLLHRQEIRKIIGKIKQKGYTLIPLSLYFNQKNIVKVELGVAKGKNLHDKRETQKERDWQREQSKILREKK